MVWDAWPFTLTATVTNPPAVDNFAVKVIVAYQTGMRSDFADLRFSKDGVALPHTIRSYTAGVSAEVWVKIPSGTTSFTLHYGNASAEDASDPDNTFRSYQATEPTVVLSAGAPLAAAAGPLTGWTYSPLEITIPAGSVTEPLDNFPVMIKLDHDSGASGTDLRGIIAILGSDANRKRIAVATANGTLCPVEIAEWSTADMRAVLWVKVPRIEPGQDTKLYLYFDPAHAEMTDYVGDTGEPAAQQVWSNGYMGVWLMKPNGGQVLDSTANGNHGIIYGATATQGPTGTVLVFDGLENYVDCGNSATLDPGANDFSLEVMAKAISGAHQRAILSKGGWYQDGFSLPTSAANNYHFVVKPSGGNYKSVSLGLGTSWDWTYISGRRSGQTISAVVDGVAKVNAYLTPGASLTSSYPLTIGKYTAGAYFFNGEIGFVALSSVARSLAWIWAMNAVLHDTFVTYSYETGVTHELAGTVEAAAGAEGATACLWSVRGTIATSATVKTPMLTRLRGISGAPGAVSISNGYLQALLDLYGAAISVQVGLSGVITRLRSLTGSAPGTGALSGVLKATNLISGAIPCTASISGLLKATLPVTAPTVSATPSCSGQIQVIANLHGAIPANATTLEPLLRATTPLTGTALPAQALIAGTLQVEAVLEVSLVAVTGATGTVICLRGVEGKVETIGAATGHLEAISQITGTIHAVSSGIGNLHAPVPLIGEIHEVSGAAGIVYSGRVAVLVPGTSAGTSVTATSPITRLRSCSGVTRGYSVVNGDLAPAVPLFADLVASSGTLANLTVGQEILFSGDTSATSLLSASLNAVISLNGALNTEGKVTGPVAYVASLTGSVLEASGVIGDLAGPKPLYVAINSGSSINGEICAVYSVNGTISCESSVSGNLTAIVPLNTECTVTGGLNGVLAVPQVEHLTGAFSATGSCTGSVAVTVRLETAIVSISEILGDLKSGVAFSSEVTPVSSVTGELSLGTAVELSGSISAVSINSGITNTRRSLTCEGAVATTTVSVWLSRAIPITCVVSEASWGQANIDRSPSLSGTIAAYSGIQGLLGGRSIRAATSHMEACVASTIREATCVRETAGYAVPITAKVSYTFSFTVISSTRKIVAKTVHRVVSNRYKEEYRVFALPDDINVTVAIPEFRVVELKEDVLVTVVDY